MKLQRERNGILFTVDFPADILIKEIESNRADWIENYTERVNGYQESVSEKEINDDIDAMIQSIKDYSSDEKGIAELFNMLPLKKNNKLSKQSKPTIYCLNVGYYIDECYGWKTQEIRVQVTDELNATVILQDTIIHY